MSIDGTSSKSNFLRTRNKAHRLNCLLGEELRNIAIMEKSNMVFIENELRAIRIFSSLIRKHCGKCEEAIPTTGKENEMLRKKLRRNPRMRYSDYDDLPDLTSRSLRKKYRLNFDIEYVIYRHKKAKHMTWPNL